MVAAFKNIKLEVKVKDKLFYMFTQANKIWGRHEETFKEIEYS